MFSHNTQDVFDQGSHRLFICLWEKEILKIVEEKLHKDKEFSENDFLVGIWGGIF